MDRVFEKMYKNCQNMHNLTTLSISQMKLSGECMKPLGEAIKGLPNLQFLNLSATNLNGHHIHELLTIINKFNCLKSIDLSYNSVKQLATTQNSDNWVIKILSNFIHYSDSLLHIDLGGMNHSQSELEYVMQHGLRKARTLISCHFAGANSYGKEHYQTLLEILNVRTRGAFDPELDMAEYNSIFAKHRVVSDAKDVFAGGLSKHSNK